MTTKHSTDELAALIEKAVTKEEVMLLYKEHSVQEAIDNDRLDAINKQLKSLSEEKRSLQEGTWGLSVQIIYVAGARLVELELEKSNENTI